VSFLFQISECIERKETVDRRRKREDEATNSGRKGGDQRNTNHRSNEGRKENERTQVCYRFFTFFTFC